MATEEFKSDENLDDFMNGLQRQTDDTIEMMRRLSNNSKRLRKMQKKTSTELANEHQRRAIAEHLAKSSEHKAEELQDKTDQLSKELTNLAEELQEKDQLVLKTVEEKNITVAKLSDHLSSQESLMKGLQYMWRHLDAFRVGQGLLSEPCGACMLPDGRVVVVDTLEGLFVFSAQTELLRHVTGGGGDNNNNDNNNNNNKDDDWKWPQGLVYDAGRGVLLVSMAKRHGGDNRYRRVIGRFTLELQVIDWLDGPTDSLVDDRVAKERVCLAPGGDLFMCLCDSGGSAIYRRSSSDSKGWALVTNRNGVSYIDCQVLAVLGSITELLVVEQRMGYVHRLSICGIQVVARQSMAIVAKPGVICVDEKRQLFVHDILAGKICQVECATFSPTNDICTTDDSVYSITASHGYLGVAVRKAKVVRIFRYVIG